MSGRDVPYVNPHCLKDNKPCNPDGYGGCTSCDEWAQQPGQTWTPLRNSEPPAGVPIVMRSVGPPQVPMREWRLATLTDFPLIVEDPTLPDIPSAL